MKAGGWDEMRGHGANRGMNRSRQLITAAACSVALLSVGVPGSAAQSTFDRDRQHFSGFSVGMNVGSQKLFGGAVIDGIDVLTMCR